jgi:P4 family phage/plasmid primase-like protien
MSNIFQDNAALYWDAGIPVIPLKRFDSTSKGAGKAPILNEWTQYGDVMPSEAVRGHWLVTYPQSNIGLPFGPASGLCAIDIDTEDQDMVKTIRDALPTSPWVRIGKKGMGLIFKWQGQPNFKLRDSENQSIVEFLGKGNQMVMPPSIHPDTKKPYTSNVNLWDVLDKIPVMPMDIEKILRDALGLKGVSLAQSGRSGPLDVVPQGERDIQMVRHAGYLARVVLGIDKNLRFPLADAMQQMASWVETYTANKSGDDMDPSKGVGKLIEFLLKDVEAGKTLPNDWDVGLTEADLAHPGIAAMIEKNNKQKWDITRARDYLEENIAKDTNDDPKYRMKVIQTLISEVAKDENFSEFEFNTLIKNIQRLSGEGLDLSRPDLKAEFKAARRDDNEQAGDHEEVARQVVEEINRGGDIIHSQGQFWQWNGAHFKAIDRKDIYMMVAKTVKGNVLVRRHNDYEAVTKTIENMVRGNLATELEEGVNFANGFLDSSLTLHDHSPKYGKTFTMPFNYIPERATEAHKWLEFLEQAWGDEPDYNERVMALQEAFAATLFGIASRYQRAFLLHGKPRTGKSQAMEVLRAIMPEDSRTSLPPGLWNERFQLSALVGKTLNLCGELPEEAVIAGDKFKMIVGGEEVPTEFKGRDGFEFKPIAAHWFASNHLPRSRDTSGGFARRWLIFDFDRVVPDSERVVDYFKVLVAEEREAIAAWAVQGLRRLQTQNEYTLPESHKMRLNQVVRANNSVAAFLQSSDKVRPGKPTDTADLRNVFDHYVYYMKEISKGWSVTYERFRQMVEELGYPVVPYQDGVGIQREEISGLILSNAFLPQKPTFGS